MYLNCRDDGRGYLLSLLSFLLPIKKLEIEGRSGWERGDITHVMNTTCKQINNPNKI
jgi:hypothetical protein